jgi:hypothetical protein
MLPENRLTLDVALNVLRMSTKYQMEQLRRGVIRLLQTDWPLNHSDYLARQKQLGSPGCRVSESMKLIKIAWSHDVPELLPTACYELAASRVQDWGEHELATSRSNLSTDDLARVLAGRERSAQRLHTLVEWGDNSLPKLWIRDDDIPPVTIFKIRSSQVRCRFNGASHDGSYYCPDLFNILKTRLGEQLVKGNSPAIFLQELGRADFNGNGGPPCAPCTDWFMSVLANKDIEMWDNLPVDFDLPKIDPKLYSDSMFKSL